MTTARQTARVLVAAMLLSSCGCAADADPPATVAPVAATRQLAPLGTGFGAVSYEEFDPLPPGGSLAELRSALPQLAGRGVALALHWKSEQIDDPARWQIVSDAQALGIDVIPVLTLPEGSDEDEEPSSPRHAQTGYFPNASNYEAWISHSKQLMAAWLARGLPPTTMLVDLEMRKRRLLRLAELTEGKTDALGVLLLLSGGIDRARQARAIAGFAAYAQHAHALGFRLHMSTLLPMLDDYRDGDDSLRQAFGVPLANDARDVPYDAVSFQIHRTMYQERYSGLSSFFVYDYARTIRALFGDRAAIDVGLTHRGISKTAPVYTSSEELRADVEGALAAGIRSENIGVYSIIGMLDHRQGSLAEWLQPPRIPPRAPVDDHVTARSHLDWAMLDLVLPGS